MKNRWIVQLSQEGAIWRFKEGDKWHVVDERGHMGVYFYSKKILCDPYRLRKFINDVFFTTLKTTLHSSSNVNWVFAANEKSYAMALAFTQVFHFRAKAGFFVPQLGVEGNKISLADWGVRQGDRVLLVGTDIHHGRIYTEAVTALQEQQAVLYPEIMTFFNSSGIERVDGCNVYSLLEEKVPIWNAADCQLCKSGSKAVFPDGNWALLQGLA